MTESEWWAATDPLRPTWWLTRERHISRTKWSLFALACCRVLECRLADWPCAEFVDTLEAFIEGRIGIESLPTTIDSDALERAPAHVLPGSRSRDSADAALSIALSVAKGRTYPAYVVGQAERALTQSGPEFANVGSTAFVGVLHDLFGPLPFRDIAVDPAWLTSDVRLLAQGVYDDKAFDRMPILADALQDAGCENEDVLTHCRAANWEHVRGCWVIDLLLGRPWKEWL